LASVEPELARLGADMHVLDEQIAPLRAELATLVAVQSSDLDELRARHRANREQRRTARATALDRSALDQQSRADTAERRKLDTRQANERADLETQLRSLEEQRAAIDTSRTAKSRDFLARIYATYSLANARGESRGLIDIFAPAAPPGGAGDCAAPKLLAYAYRHALRPIALAEFWVGAPPATGGRSDGHFYPACRGKCGPILAHMLSGLDVEPAPQFGADAIDPREPTTLFEDPWLAIVVKPAGLLSVPGRGTLSDCVQTRLRARYPTATGPLVVHRLDLDTSGLLLVAKDLATYTALQRLFSERAIDKRYIAWLDGDVRGDRGTIELPLRVDLDDRPRQIVDEVHGKSAVTEWEVIERAGSRTKVMLSPKTGRAHQLRVHAAHPLGLGAPIVGDRLYGRAAERLMLHAEAIELVHPHTHERLGTTSPAPF
jgi:tRNA pseudouridine32 synthase/23S rRNA pseudouridine746 synthase